MTGATRVLLAVAASTLVGGAAAAAGRVETPSMFSPSSTPADAIEGYTMLVVAICAGIFFVVAALLVVAIVRFRERPGDTRREPPQIYGSAQIELAWTVIPVLIVVVLALVTARTILELQKTERPEGWLGVTAIGHQWWWEFHYPELGIVTANELHVPAGTPTFVELESQDVIHSFWVPQLSGKTDVVPNRVNTLWMEPREPGLYVGQCAEYCGTQHAYMLLRVYVDAPADFERWVAAQRRVAAANASVHRGREVFETTACVSCHTVRGTDAGGRFGPDLTHLMSRETIGAGVAMNDRANLIEWVTRPDHLKPGVRMPAMQLESDRIELLVDYLVTLE